MKRDILKTSITFLALALTVLISSCQSEEERIRISKAEKRAKFVEDSLSLKIGVLPTEDCYKALVAEKLGLFDTLGVVVHLRHMNALSECRQALKKKQIEGAYIDKELASILQKEDTTALFFGPETSLSWKLIASKNSRVLRIAQLTEKTVAADSHGESHVLAEQALDSINRKKMSAFVVQCEDINVRYNMMHINNVDAAMLPEPMASKALKEGDNLLKDYTKKKYGVLVMRQNSINDKRIKKQYDLYLKALNIANDSIRKYGISKYIK